MKYPTRTSPFPLYKIYVCFKKKTETNFSFQIPHHIADIALIKEETSSFSIAIKYVSFAGLFSVIGGVLSFYLLDSFYEILPYLLVLASSSFVYVALADLIPQLKKKLIT